MPETLPATATVSASSIDCTVAVLKVPTPTMQMPEACNLQSLGLIMEPNNINIELNPAATTSGFKFATGRDHSGKGIPETISAVYFIKYIVQITYSSILLSHGLN
ncbi:uncharacterized protein LOC122322878 [Drosophila grimshawi]|uniref:uncharacterized protein LOC122322878 n=1 Tax=Drosophila grimshawi TaxID=7222 RepID=UPI001C935015|nr:uncharacterized protein LOC122322878 [Drosophila grimshawi]